MPFERIFFDNKPYVYLICIFLGISAVYFWSMPKTVVLEDDGYFILASYFNSIAHPPGYPLYSLLGKLATLVPIGSVATRVHALSALAGALACVFLWVIVKILLKEKILATLAAVSFAFSGIFWSQSIIAEVYSLNALLFLLLVYLVLCLLRYEQNEGYLKWTGFIYGLSLCNHWPLLLLSTPLLLAFLWPKKNNFLYYIKCSAPYIILGLFPYVWMVVRSYAVPELSFGGPFSTVADFWRFFSREEFSDVDSSPSAGWQDKYLFSIFVLEETVRQFSMPLFALVVVGFISQWRYFPNNICTGLLLGFLGNTFFLILLLDFDFDLFHRNTFRVYPIIAYAICAIWLALGFHKLLEVIHKKTDQLNRKSITYGLASTVVGIIFFANMPDNYRGNDVWAEDYAKVILNNIEKDAVLYANADTINGPVGYLNRVENFREDIVLFSGFSINIADRFYRLYQYHSDELRSLVNTFVQTEKRPIYYTNDLPHDCRTQDFGLFIKIDTADCEGAHQVMIVPQVIDYLAEISLRSAPRDPWENMHYWLLRQDYCRLMINTVDIIDLGEVGSLSQHPQLDLACGHYLGINSLIEVLLIHSQINSRRHWEFIDSLMTMAEVHREGEGQVLTKADYAILDLHKGDMWLYRDRLDEALVNYRLAVKQWPHPDNPAVDRIKTLEGYE